MKLTRNYSLSEELTQETFFRAYMNFTSLKNREKASVWLCQIAKNTYYAWYNEHKKIDSLENTEAQNDLESIWKQGIDIFIFKILKKPQSFYESDLGEFGNIEEIYWKDDNCLVINSAEYKIE